MHTCILMIPPKARCYRANDSTPCPSRFYYWDAVLFIHHWLLGDAGWQDVEVAPALPSPQPSVKTTAILSPPFFSPFFLSLPSFCFPLARGLCQRQAKVEQALFSSSDRLVVLASKERGPIDGKVDNAPSGVRVNIIKRRHAW